MKIVFFGTPEFGSIILEKLIQADQRPVLVVTSPDKPVGRRQVLTPSEVKVVATKHDIPVLELEKYSEAVKEELGKKEPDLFVLAAFGKILPQEVLDIPKNGALNVHPSLLPKFRGPSPVQETILQGEERTGVTIILMDEEIDHGPIVAQEGFSRFPSEFTAEELKAELADLGGRLIVQVIPNWLEGKIKPIVQDDSKATFTKMLDRMQGRIDWNKEAEYIERQVRAFYPWPGTSTVWQGKTLKILKAKVVPLPQKVPPGTVMPFEQQVAVAAGKDAVLIQELQLEGKNPVSSKDFLLGHKDILGTTLS